MTNKKVFKKSLKWSLVFYVVAIIISILLREFSPIKFWDDNPTNDYNLIVKIISPYTFLIVGLFLGSSMLYDFLFWEYFSFSGFLIVAFINIILFLIIFIFVYNHFGKKESIEKNKFLKFSNFIVKFSPLIILLIIGCSYLIYSINYGWKRDLSIEEYITCVEAEKIKTTGYIYITEEGVCATQKVCNNFSNIFECENVNSKPKNDHNFRVIKNLDKNNFDFEVLDNSVRGDFISIKVNVNNEKYNFVFGRTDIYLILDEYVDLKDFQYLGGKYSKDKKNVYYKSEIIGADSETFIYERGNGKAIGKGRDKNGTWIKGILQDK